MDQDAVLKGMAQRLVEDMEGEEPKNILLAVVSGVDVFEAILGDGTGPAPEKPRRKRGGGRKRKAVTPEGGNDEKSQE